MQNDQTIDRTIGRDLGPDPRTFGPDRRTVAPSHPRTVLTQLLFDERHDPLDDGVDGQVGRVDMHGAGSKRER